MYNQQYHKSSTLILAFNCLCDMYYLHATFILFAFDGQNHCQQ